MSSTRSTFEDRLLAELQQEVALGAQDRPAPVRRRVPARRVAYGVAACTAAAAVVVALPGSPAETPAYAVEKNPDGSVSLSLSDLMAEPEEQHKLADDLAEVGVGAVIDNPPAGTTCQPDRGEDQVGWLAILEAGPSSDDPGDPPAPSQRQNTDVRSLAWGRDLRKGDTLIIENMSLDGRKGSQTRFSYAAGEIEPCKPVPQPAG